MTFKSIGQITDYKPLANCGMEELAARQRIIQPSTGVAFARTTERPEKAHARQLLLDLFHPSQWPGHLHLLTMPGINWRFERLLLATREEGWMRRAGPKRTFFTSAENDRAIYFAAVAHMPGLHTPDANVKQKRSFDLSFAEFYVKTRYCSFFFANIDDMLTYDGWRDGCWDAVWLDYTGPLTIERLKIIERFYRTGVRSTLIITALKARWTLETGAAINKAGGHSAWLRQHLPGDVLHDIEYEDTVPMAQFAVRHSAPLWFWDQPTEN